MKTRIPRHRTGLITGSAPITGPVLVTGLVLILSIVAAGCGVGSAADPPTEEGETADTEGFFERAFRTGPVEATVPAGTLLAVRFNETLSSHQTSTGTPFSAVVSQDVAVDGSTVVPAGSVVHGTVTLATPARKIGGRARLGLSFHTLELPGGATHSIDASFAQAGRSEAPKDAAIIGGSTLGGAILGDAVDDGDGTVIGAVVGGIAGTVGALKTQGKPVEVPAGSTLSLELTTPFVVEVS